MLLWVLQGKALLQKIVLYYLHKTAHVLTNFHKNSHYIITKMKSDLIFKKIYIWGLDSLAKNALLIKYL